MLGSIGSQLGTYQLGSVPSVGLGIIVPEPLRLGLAFGSFVGGLSMAFGAFVSRQARAEGSATAVQPVGYGSVQRVDDLTSGSAE